MKIIELRSRKPSMDEVIEAAQHDDVLLVRDGHALARLEKFRDEDWADWQYEHSRAAVRRGRLARKQYARGEFVALEELRTQDDSVREAPARYGRTGVAKRKRK